MAGAVGKWKGVTTESQTKTHRQRGPQAYAEEMLLQMKTSANQRCSESMFEHGLSKDDRTC